MRIVHCIAVLTGLCLGVAQTGLYAAPNMISGPVGSNLVAGRLNVPPDMVPRIANSSISNLYGVPLGTTAADGSFRLPPSPVSDIEIIFVKAPNSDDVIVMGYADGDVYNIGVEGTALAMLLMFNPANGALDLNGKRALLKAAKANPDFWELTQAIQKSIDNRTNVSAPSDSQMIGLLSKIQTALPRAPLNANALANNMVQDVTNY